MATRDYKREYAIRSKKDRDNRQHRRVARRLLQKRLGIKRLRGKDVDHKDKNPRNNSRKNLRVQSKSKNRSNNY
ncbi:HNH endonuclease [Pelagibacteraceae bacterium]|nr:HNH endonuclease [Pelagibacteraceae bacterium]|tara:strand:+ start:1746 stop:1967 length:222 start_codon:yes stop_codon:yes gene_type:complete